jgi:hypothetical protein
VKFGYFFPPFSSWTHHGHTRSHTPPTTLTRARDKKEADQKNLCFFFKTAKKKKDRERQQLRRIEEGGK